MQITRIHTLTEDQAGELLGLMEEMDSGITVTADMLRAAAGKARLYALVEDGRIIGSATLVISASPTGNKAYVEDVVVKEEYRGRGFGRQLVEHLIAEAREFAPVTIQLTSRPARVAANGLYRSLGFQRRETNAYKLELLP